MSHSKYVASATSFRFIVKTTTKGESPLLASRVCCTAQEYRKILLSTISTGSFDSYQTNRDGINYNTVCEYIGRLVLK